MCCAPQSKQESSMSKITKITVALCLVAFVAACAKKAEEVTFVETPVVAEPVLSKY